MTRQNQQQQKMRVEPKPQIPIILAERCYDSNY